MKRRNAEAEAVDQASVFETQLDLVEFSNEKVKQHRKRGKGRNKDIRRKEQERITRASDYSNVVQPAAVTNETATNVVAFSSKNSSAEDKVSTKKVEHPIELPPSDALEFIYEVGCQVKPALYIVLNWDEFVDDGW